MEAMHSLEVSVPDFEICLLKDILQDTEKTLDELSDAFRQFVCTIKDAEGVPNSIKDNAEHIYELYFTED